MRLIGRFGLMLMLATLGPATSVVLADTPTLAADRVEEDGKLVAATPDVVGVGN